MSESLTRGMEIFWPLVRSVYFLLDEIFAWGGRLQSSGGSFFWCRLFGRAARRYLGIGCMPLKRGLH